jgi:transcription-repair coupling factor (superfamily II helicase)
LFIVAKDGPAAVAIAVALAGGAPDATIALCPGSDAMPGDSAPPSPSNVGQRTSALRRVRAALTSEDRTRVALVTTGEATARLYPPPEQFDATPPVVRIGQELDLEDFSETLAGIGYVPDDRVDEPGEMAMRGQVLDIFPADRPAPYRIEIHDGRIDSIRSYDAATQLGLEECETLELGRAAEPEASRPVTLMEHLPEALLVLEAGADKRRRRFLALASDALAKRAERAARDVCPEEVWQARIAEHPPLYAAPAAEPPPRFIEQRSPLRAFRKAALAAIEAGRRIVLLGTVRDLRFLALRVQRTLNRQPQPVRSWREACAAAPGSVLTLEMLVPRGFSHDGIMAVAAADLLGSRAQRGDEMAPASAADLFALGEVRIGDVVVHEEHGIAVVAGLEALPGDAGDAIVLRFAGDSRRMVPVAEAGRVWRYGAEEEAVTLDKLDGSSWAKRRRQVDEAIAGTARELVALAEKRISRSAPVLEPSGPGYERFAARFPFTETGDQTRAIDAVRDDLASGKPMDRLVIGDVGYGKTEVALRAAAIAAFAGCQVALVAPTTVLARQHLETFTDRFAGLGVTVAGLSRFTSPAERKRVVAGLKDGSIQVVVGTSAVAGKAIAFKDLALVIIDEEQKFGTATKAKLRSLGAGHVLTLSATPIPRTLQGALVGLQQLALIATPPARRQPIRTSLAAFDPQTLRTALLRERSRHGQSFVVVPRVEDIAPIAAQLARLVPELTVLQAHGKMPAPEIDEAMVAFAAGQGDVLLATNIIESGLDVPRANTMIVWRADMFGLSQLHQLRGRVGRGARRGQIYLLTEAGAEIAPRTVNRLRTLQAFDRLGAGFAISARDLDLRGAGDLLSEEQTGHVKLIGVDLYQHLLEHALRAARGEPTDEWAPVLNLETSGRLPAEWIAEEDLRIGLYARLARIADVPALDAFEDELVDRFGELPADAGRLLARARLGLLAREARIARIDAGVAAIAFTPGTDFTGDPAAAGLEPSEGRLLLKERLEDPADRLRRAEEVLGELAS